MTAMHTYQSQCGACGRDIVITAMIEDMPPATRLGVKHPTLRRAEQFDLCERCARSFQQWRGSRRIMRETGVDC